MVIGAEGILRCSTKSLLLLTITSQQFIRSTLMINHREFTIAYLGSCLLRYDAEPFALRGLGQNDSFVRNQTDSFLSCSSISLLHTRLLDIRIFGERTVGISMVH